MKKSEKDKNWRDINKLMILILWFGSCFFVFTFVLSRMFFIMGIAVNLVLALFYGIYKNHNRCRTAVIVFRTISITILVLTVLAPVILVNFKKTKILYSVKRFCYSYGVHGITNNTVLPSSLPEKCDDYMFITKGSFPAQDYHASAYLVFHTDSETLKEYENHFDSLYNAELKTAHMPDKEKYISYDDLWLKCPEELPQDVFGRLEPEHIHDFKNSIIYTVPTYYSKGCMLDYKSGLAVFWY